MMFASLAAGLPLPLINLVAAVIYYYINKKKSRFVRFHILQSLISQIPISILNAGLVGWFIRNMVMDAGFSSAFQGYAIAVVIANIVYFIFSIIAAVKARKGLFYYFLFFGAYSYQKVFKKGGSYDKEEIYTNQAHLKCKNYEQASPDIIILLSVSLH